MKKNFFMGYVQIALWFIAWVFFGFVNAAGGNIYRTGVSELHGIDFALILQASSIAGWVSAVLFLAVPKITEKSVRKTFSCGLQL